MSSSFMIPKSCRIWITGVPLRLNSRGDFLVLQVVNQTLVFDEGQQRV